VSNLYSGQQGHAEGWQVCLAHQLRDCQYAIDAGDTAFPPRMKGLLLRAIVLARRSRDLAKSTRRAYRRRLEHDLNRVVVLAPTPRDGRRLPPIFIIEGAKIIFGTFQTGGTGCP
jgi:transposase